MKKILLLLFLIPNLVMGEEIMLICKGIAATSLMGSEANYSPDELAVIVNDDFIEWDGESFKSKPHKYEDENGDSFNSVYYKDEKKIIFDRTVYGNGKLVDSSRGEINRLTGEVSFSNTKKNPNIINGFVGKCKKSEKAF